GFPSTSVAGLNFQRFTALIAFSSSSGVKPFSTVASLARPLASDGNIPHAIRVNSSLRHKRPKRDCYGEGNAVRIVVNAHAIQRHRHHQLDLRRQPKLIRTGVRRLAARENDACADVTPQHKSPLLATHAASVLFA